jgi:colanic acid/amylovoran biosynthesis glycosyltransferase
MRVAFYSHGFPYFHQTFIHTEIAGLKALGHDVKLYACFNPHPEKVNSTFERFGLAGAVRYFNRHDRVAFEPFWTSKDLLATWDGVSRTELDALEARPLVQEIAEADVVHAPFANGSATVASVLARLAKRPFTFEAYAYDLFVDFSHARAKIAQAARIFPTSEYNRQYLIDKWQCPPDHALVRHVTFDTHEADRLRAVAREERLLVSVCRLHPIKGLAVALDAVAALVSEFPDLRYVLIGDGPLRDSLETQVRDLGLQSHVQFLGDLSNREALQWIARASAMVLPSMIAADGDRDGIPTALYEAMYLETPVVSTRVSGIPELVTHGVTGWLAEPGDAAGIAAGVRMLLRDQEVRRAWSAAGRARVRSIVDEGISLRVLADGLAEAASLPAGAHR